MARSAGVANGGERRVLLMPHEHVADGMVVEGVVERKRDPARVAEDAVDPFSYETFE